MYLLLADDFTGGNDAGIQFAKCGIDSRLALSVDGGGALNPDSADGFLLAVNANTRNMPAQDGADCLNAFITGLRASGIDRPSMVFHKIDSSLRGNPGTEMDAIMDGFGFGTAFLTPAFPKQGRSVVDGVLLVNGIPVAETGFARDPLTPVTESSVVSRVEGQSRRKAGMVSLAELESGADAITARLAELQNDGVECIVFDAVTQEHLSAIAETGLSLRERPLFIGSAGLAEAVARHLSHDAEGGEGMRLSPAKHVFFICGSANQATHEQTEALEKAGIPVVRMPGNFPADSAAANQVVHMVADALERGAAVLAAPLSRIGEAGDMEKGKAVSDALSDLAFKAISRLGGDPRSTALVMTGGETAFAVFERLGSGLTLHKELLPGIALCSVAGGGWNGLQVVTKAGGFGTRSTFVELLNMLQLRTTAL